MILRESAKRVIDSFQKSNLFQRATQAFGTTTDFSKAAWILPDGRMLNFSGPKGVSRADHSQIKKIFTEQELQQDPGHYVSEDIYARDKFLDAGAVRLVSEGGGIQMKKRPTPQQINMIQKFLQHIKYGEFYLDLSGKGSEIKKMYDNTPQDRAQVIDTIQKYYAGQLGNKNLLQQFRYADGERKRVPVKDIDTPGHFTIA